MDVIKLAISRPVGVAVGVILVVLFGVIGASQMPVQLSPTVDRPEIQVATTWPGRSPQEVVDEITREQEEVLKNVDNLRRMTSVSRQGGSEINLEFYINADITRALQDVSDSLRQVPDYPDDANEPTIIASTGAAENAIAWIIVDLAPGAIERHPGFDISTLYDALDNEVKPMLERIDGVAEVNIYGGREREVRVLVDLRALAQRGLTHIDLLEALRRENTNVSAGTIAEGKRDYRVRVMGQFTEAEDFLSTIVAYRDSGPVYVRDVAEVEMGYVKRRGFVRSLGHPAIAMNLIRQSDANVMSVMASARETLDEVRDVLPLLHPTAGPDLRLRQVYDETIYIDSAISLVSQNLWIGGSIAIVVLLLFLRSFVATGVIALAIPVSIVGTFLALLAMGRTLNVISLAGLAFAVGMVVDNAIVVLENIFRHRQMGKPPLRAAYDGGREVWGAILASTLTTVAVFVPVLTVQEEAGQLFRDISLAIVSAVALSLLVSTTVIPAACSRWLGEMKDPSERHAVRRLFENLFGVVPLMGAVSLGLKGLIRWLITGWRAWTLRPAIILGLTAASLGGAVLLMPPLDYLPAGNRNLVFGGLLIPPGYSIEQQEQVAQRIEAQVEPYMRYHDGTIESSAVPPIGRRPERDPATGGFVPRTPFDPIPIDNFFIAGFNGGMFAGATSAEPEVVLPAGQLLTNAFNTIPDAFGGAQQTSLFGRGVGGGNTLDVEIAGPNLDRVKAAAARIFYSLGGSPDYGFGRVRPDPSNFLIQQPETQVRVNTLGTELGLRADGVGTAVSALFDGAFVGDFRTGRDTIDIRLLPAGGRLQYKEQLADVPVATPRGPVVPLDSVVEVVEGLAPQEIRRSEELPAVTIRVQPPDGIPLDEVKRDITENHIAPVRADGMIDRTMRVRLEGTAAKLDEVKAALIGAPEPDGAMTTSQRVVGVGAIGLFGVSVIACLWSLVRAVAKRRVDFAYGALGLLFAGAAVAGAVLLLDTSPHLLTARIVWALLVTYLLMCALFESFVYPFVIMFCVPLAVVGGFIGLQIVHAQTAANPTIATQNLDVLTILGFVILFGVVVNNAILIVHQSLNLMAGTADTRFAHNERLEPMEAIAEAVRTRLRPVFMSTLTSVGGMMPLVLFPGAGSELYRGLGAVVVGGLLLSTVFTLLLTPLLFSLVVQMSLGVRALRGRASGTESLAPAPQPAMAMAGAPEPAREPATVA